MFVYPSVLKDSLRVCSLVQLNLEQISNPDLTNTNKLPVHINCTKITVTKKMWSPW